MGLRSYAYAIVAAAGASGKASLLTVPDGRRFRLTKVIIAFPVGSEGKLRLRVVAGPVAVAPTQGWLQGDGTTITLDTDHEYTAGSTVKLEYINDDTLNEHTAYVVIQGEMV